MSNEENHKNVSKGKLYTEITSGRINVDWTDTLFKNADYDKGELVTQKQILLEILNEAITEFPTLDKVRKFKENAGRYFYNYDESFLFAKIVDAWLKKYFGKSIFTPIDFSKGQFFPAWFETKDREEKELEKWFGAP